MELSAIAAAVIGGVSLAGGVGSMFGPALGAFLLGAILLGLTLLQVSQYLQQIITGAILLAAVGYDRLLASQAAAPAHGQHRIGGWTNRSSEAPSLTKVYGNLVALNGASITVMPGEVRALIGSNGAGKSTLIKMLTGAIAADPGQGRDRRRGRAARRSARNDPARRGLHLPALQSRAGHVGARQHLSRPPADARASASSIPASGSDATRASCSTATASSSTSMRPSASLPTVKQKEVEIMKALALDARVILMDEPTGWLAASEVAKLHATIRALKARGVGIVYISHMLDEIFAVCDTMTIMRDGKVIAESAVADIDRSQRRAPDGRRKAGARVRAGEPAQAAAQRHRRDPAQRHAIWASAASFAT